MKFLLEFVTCCTTTPASSTSCRDDDEADGTHGGDRRSEETRALMTIVSRRCKSKQKKRGRVGATSGAVADDWKPTLTSISEDTVAAQAAEKAGRVVKRKGGGGCGGRSGSRNIASIAGYNEDRRNKFTMIPTFSATPFMI
ncbi:uncharacterized protein LOC126667045 [Mercurialis annua]|uniref:uncharacterized protein LOC126667045 n=1 Tax=Mercurialis annua TaxID=3986 RepID=UPI00215E2234|nr:uncharacterized protein LOC126667045 [Mercurialis annua]